MTPQMIAMATEGVFYMSGLTAKAMSNPQRRRLLEAACRGPVSRSLFIQARGEHMQAFASRMRIDSMQARVRRLSETAAGRR